MLSTRCIATMESFVLQVLELPDMSVQKMRHCPLLPQVTAVESLTRTMTCKGIGMRLRHGLILWAPSPSSSALFAAASHFTCLVPHGLLMLASRGAAFLAPAGAGHSTWL